MAGELGKAVKTWPRSRKRRTLVMGMVFVAVTLGLLGARESDVLTSSHKTYHLPSWRPYFSSPSTTQSPLRPSNLTLELENGEVAHPPAQLKKATPNFHLLMSALEDSPEFCRTTLSAMILNYPPPTVVNLFSDFKSPLERDKARIENIRDYLLTRRVVRDEDLVLIVDGQGTWFQLPSDVMILQYQNMVADANERLLEKFGTDTNGDPKFKQTIFFGAEKTCSGEDLACRYAPASPLSGNIYGRKTGKETVLTPARYLDSAMMMGPAKDLRVLYETAAKKLEAKNSEAGTAQSVFATMFAEQELERSSKIGGASKFARLKSLAKLGGGRGRRSVMEPSPPMNDTLNSGQHFEFSIGLDYTHTLFQPLHNTAEDELVPLKHDNTTDLTHYHHADTPSLPLALPTALLTAQPPFWTPDLTTHNPSPHDKPTYISQLQIQPNLDDLPPSKTPWSALPLIQNTYTGSIPPTLHFPSSPNQNLHTRQPHLPYTSLWHARHSRALLRTHLRTPQSALGFHNAAVGGDKMWDQRGGRGGVWTQEAQIWLPWGEVDGVCGSVEQMREVFADGRGVWLHEGEVGAEEARRKEEEELRRGIEEGEKEGGKSEEEREREERERAGRVDRGG